MKNWHPFQILLVASFLTIATPAMAEETTITVKKNETPNIAFKTFVGSDGAAAQKVVTNDLDLSGVFLVGIPERASFFIAATVGGGSLQGVVTDNRGGTILQKTYSGDARRTAHQFSDDIVQTITGGKGIATSKLAFASARTGKKEIYIADYDGANARQLTNEGSISVGPALSWDGSKLAYTGYQSGYADIYVIDLASGARNRVVKFPGTNSGPAFSPDGGRLAATLSKDGNPELYIMGVNGAGARRLTRTAGGESSPTWSPSGSEIIYSSDERGGPQLFRIGAGGGTGRPLATGHSYSTEPSWSPDGKKVAFTVRQGGFAIAVLDLDSGTTRVVAQGEDPTWAANSRHLIYSAGSSLNLLDTVRGRNVPVVTGLGKVSEPSLSR